MYFLLSYYVRYGYLIEASLYPPLIAELVYDIFSASGAALSDGLDIGYPILSTHSISSSVEVIIYRRDTACKTQIISQIIPQIILLLITGQR